MFLYERLSVPLLVELQKKIYILLMLRSYTVQVQHRLDLGLGFLFAAYSFICNFLNVFYFFMQNFKMRNLQPKPLFE